MRWLPLRAVRLGVCIAVCVAGGCCTHHQAACTGSSAACRCGIDHVAAIEPAVTAIPETAIPETAIPEMVVAETPVISRFHPVPTRPVFAPR